MSIRSPILSRVDVATQTHLGDPTIMPGSGDRRHDRRRGTRDDRGRAENAHYERLGREHRASRRQPPSPIHVGRADIWCCGQDDVTESFLNSFIVMPLVVTCKNKRVPEVEVVCRRVLGEPPYLFNVGHRPERNANFMWLLDEVKSAVDAGRDVIFHCRAGVHRAAITTVLMLMFGLGCTLQEG